MPKLTKNECWDILEDRLNTISETRLGVHNGEAKFAIALIVSAGREEDIAWIESNIFDYWCKVASLHLAPTRELIIKTLAYLSEGGRANFRQALLEA